MMTVPDRMDSAQGELTTTPIPWTQFTAELLMLYQPPMVAKATRCKMKQVLSDISALDLTSNDAPRVEGEEPLRIATTADLRVSLIAQLIASRPEGQSLHTLQSILAVARTICSYAETAGYLRVSPFRLRKLSKWVRLPTLADKRHLTRDEIRRILDLAIKHVRERSGWAQWRARRTLVVIAIIAYTGIRKMECLRLHLSDIDLVARVIWIRPHGTALKTAASEAPIPIPKALLPLLTDWIAHRMDAPFGYPMPKMCCYLIPTLNRKAAWTSGQPGGKALDRFGAVAALAGVPGATFQMLRRSWATHAEMTMSDTMISRVLRHTNTNTAKKHYRKADIHNMLEATQDFDF